MAGITDALTFGIEGVIGTFIFLIVFTAFLPSIIDTINNGSGFGLPQATILIVSLIGLIFVAGIALRIWKKVTGQDNEQPGMGGGY